MRRFTGMAMMLAVSVLPGIAQVPSQSPFGGIQSHTPGKTTAVSYLFPEQVTVVADKATAVDLHFKVASGLHVNSHAPHSEELIPTTLTLPEGSGVKLAKLDFPPGRDFVFDADPGRKLSVYTGEFIVHVEFIAAKGDHLVQATLRYQACDNNTCMPPHSIPVAIDVIAK